ncbi:hypothetical protein KEM56_002272 [Ascosphaera pollenicola]|nr:hypothetical protein KEM56_002272 [Ascosphaera pollenicola]
MAFQGVVEEELPQIEHEFSEKDGREGDPHTSRIREIIYDSPIQRLTLNMESGVHQMSSHSIANVIERSIVGQALESVLSVGWRGEPTRWVPDVGWRRHNVLPIVYEGVVEVAHTQTEGSLQRDIDDWFTVDRDGRRIKTGLAVRIEAQGDIVFRLYGARDRDRNRNCNCNQGAYEKVQTVTVRPAQGPDRPGEIDGRAMTIPLVDDKVMVLGRPELTVIAKQTWAEMRDRLPYPDMDLTLQRALVPGFTAAKTSSLDFH